MTSTISDHDRYADVMAEASRQHQDHLALFDKALKGDPEAVVAVQDWMSLEAMRDRDSAKADALIQVAVDDFAGSHAMTASNVHHLVGYTGRVYGPRALYVLDLFGAISPDAYAEVVPHVWGIAEFPGAALARADWRRLFGKAGFTVEGVPADRPTEPVRLWRGAWRRDKGGLSWTTTRSRAEWFVKARSGDQRLWTTLAPPGALLCYQHEAGRGEDEWIVDTRGLTIEEVTA